MYLPLAAVIGVGVIAPFWVLRVALRERLRESGASSWLGVAWLAAALALTLPLGVVAACGSGGGANGNSDDNSNENGSATTDVISAIVADLQRAFDCGDTSNPVLTAEQAEQALTEQYEASGLEQSFGDFLLEQAQIISQHADLACGLAGGQNSNENG